MFAAIANPQSRPTVKTFLRGSFTAIDNEALETVLLDLPLSENRVLLVLCRFSTGFLRDWCFVGEQKLMDMTHLSRSTVYAAKNSLAHKGIIEIGHSKTGCCIYRLAERYQALKTSDSAAPVRSAGPLPVRPVGPMKDNKENLKYINNHHHCKAVPVDDDFLENSFVNWESLEPESPAPVAKPVPVAAVAEEAPTLPNPEPKATSSLTRRLLEVGVNAFMARRLVQNHPEELIQSALERVRLGNVKNPAGYLVSEISRGGYAAPANPAKVIAERHEQVHQRRQTEKQQEEQSRQASNEAAVTRQLELFEKLPPLQRDIVLRTLQQQAERERFHKLPGWGPEHPVWRGLLAEIVRKRAEKNEGVFVLQTAHSASSSNPSVPSAGQERMTFHG